MQDTYKELRFLLHQTANMLFMGLTNIFLVEIPACCRASPLHVATKEQFIAFSTHAITVSRCVCILMSSLQRSRSLSHSCRFITQCLSARKCYCSSNISTCSVVLISCLRAFALLSTPYPLHDLHYTDDSFLTTLFPNPLSIMHHCSGSTSTSSSSQVTSRPCLPTRIPPATKTRYQTLHPH